MRLGTRGSPLALIQAEWVAARVPGPVEIITVTTPGDRAQRLGDKARWVSELESALLDGRIDCAVHSAKDVPGELPDGLTLVAFPAREDPRDAICGAPSLASLPRGARVGTSSLRRRAQMLATRPDLEIIAVRGNVDTRLGKLAAGEVDALVLALAGLRRLDREGAVDGILGELIPAAGQGALAIEARGESDSARILAALDHAQSSACVSAERALTRALGASCQTAVGAHARMSDDSRIELSGWAGMPDGSAWVSDRQLGTDPESLGRAVGKAMLAAGAGELLAAAEPMP